MFSRILILALFGCSLVLASPKPENENVLDVFKPENAVKTGLGLLNLAGDAVKNAIGAGKKFVETGVSNIKTGASKIIEFQKNIIVKTIENLVEIIAFLNEQLFALGVGEIFGPGMKVVENIAKQVDEFVKKGLKGDNPVQDIADNLGNLASQLPKDQQKKIFNGNIFGYLESNINGYVGKVSGKAEVNVSKKLKDSIGGVNPFENNGSIDDIVGGAVDNTKEIFGKISETVEDNLNIPEKVDDVIGIRKGIMGKISPSGKKGCFGTVVQKVSGAVDKTTDVLGEVTAEGSKKLTHVADVVEAAEKFRKGKTPVSEDHEEPAKDDAQNEGQENSVWSGVKNTVSGWFGK